MTDSDDPGQALDPASDNPTVKPSAESATARTSTPKTPEPAVDETTRPQRAKSGRPLAVLSLLVALAAAGVGGYLFWLAWVDDPDARIGAVVQPQLEDWRRDSARRAEVNAQEFAALRDELVSVRADLAAQQAALAEAQAAMAEAIMAQSDTQPPSPREWKLAEVEYLLSIANHRLLLQRDVDSADALLARADGLLAEVDDFAYHEVRAMLADERLALRTFEGVDLQGLFLRVEAVKGLLERLPLRLPEYIADTDLPRTEGAPADDGSMFEALLSRLEGLVRFRRHEGTPMRPLLAPEQADYLEQHLRLALDRAQLAVLRGNQAIFEASLLSAKEWLHRFVDPNHATVVEATRELDELLAVDLEITPPDISGALARLRELRSRARERARSHEAAPE